MEDNKPRAGSLSMARDSFEAVAWKQGQNLRLSLGVKGTRWLVILGKRHFLYLPQEEAVRSKLGMLAPSHRNNHLNFL